MLESPISRGFAGGSFLKQAAVPVRVAGFVQQERFDATGHVLGVALAIQDDDEDFWGGTDEESSPALYGEPAVIAGQGALNATSFFRLGISSRQ